MDAIAGLTVDGHLPIMLGEAPSRTGDRYHMFPLSGRVAQTVCGLAGIEPQPEGSRYGRWTWALYEHFECHNLIHRWPGAQGAGAAFPMPLAAEAAAHVLPPLDGRVIVMLGARLPKVLGTAAADFHEWRSVRLDHYGEFVSGIVGDVGDVWAEGDTHQLPRARVVTIPHPSGLNRRYNDEEERAQAGQTLREAIRLADTSTLPPRL